MNIPDTPKEPLPSGKEDETTKSSTNVEKPILSNQLLPPSYQIKLRLIYSDAMAEDHMLHRSLTIIGREDGDILIKDPLISRKHFSIEVYNLDYVIAKDLASTNGTFVNGHLVTSTKVFDGDVIRIGNVDVVLSIKRAEETSSTSKG